MNAYALLVEDLTPVRAPETVRGEFVLLVSLNLVNRPNGANSDRTVELIEVEAVEVRKAA